MAADPTVSTLKEITDLKNEIIKLTSSLRTLKTTSQNETPLQSNEKMAVNKLKKSTYREDCSPGSSLERTGIDESSTARDRSME